MLKDSLQKLAKARADATRVKAKEPKATRHERKAKEHIAETKKIYPKGLLSADENRGKHERKGQAHLDSMHVERGKDKERLQKFLKLVKKENK